MTTQDAGNRTSERAVFVAAAREHSAAVNRHLERVAVRLREHGHPLAADPAPRAPLTAALEDLSRLLLADGTPQSVLASVLAVARSGVVGCDSASITVVQGPLLETGAATDDEAARSDRRQYEARCGPCYQSARTGETVQAPILAETRWAAVWAEDEAPWGGLVSAPMRTGDQLLGALNVYSRTPGALRPEVARTVELLAEHAARALVTTREIGEQRALAASLQHSLLPPSLPQVPGLTLAAHYRPASSGINVGGDWYDVLVPGEQRIVLVIGDVAGHGLAAAMTMADLRTAVRAYALEGHDPAEILQLVDAFLQHLEPDGYATCAVVAIDVGARSVRWANAGHPDPLVILRNGTTRPLAPGGAQPALGVPRPPGARYRPGTDVLPPGARLLLFTDGLVERRSEPLGAGLDRLARSAVAVVDAADTLQAWCEQIVSTLLGGMEVADDVAVLTAELAESVQVADAERLSMVAG